MKYCILTILFMANFLTALAEKLPANIPASSNVLARLDLKSIIDNPLIQKIKKTSPKYKEFLTKLKKGASFDFEKTDAIWFVGKNMEEGVLIFKGNFNSDDIISTLVLNTDIEPLERKGCKFAAIFPDENNKDIKNMGLVIDDNTVVFGKEAAVESYLETAQGKHARLNRKIRGKIARFFKNKNDFKVVFLRFLWPVNNPGMQALLDSLNAGILNFDLSKDLDVQLAFVFKTEQGMQQFQPLIEMLLTKQLSNKQGSKIAMMIRNELNANVNMETDKKTLIARSKITEKKLNGLLSFFLLRKAGMERGKNEDY